MSLDTSNIFRIRSIYSDGYYISVAVDGSIELINSNVPSAPNSQASTVWVLTPATANVSISGGVLTGYNLKNLCTNQYFGWTSPPGKIHVDAEPLITVPNTTVVNLLPHAPSGSYLIFFRGRSPTTPSGVFANGTHVFGWIYAGYTASQYYALNTQPRWVFEAVGKVSPPTIQPEFKSPVVKKDPVPDGLYRIRSYTGTYLLTMPEAPLDAGGRIIPYVAKQVPKNEYQRWQVTRQENGLYTVQNSGNNLYLAAPSSNLATGTLLLGQSETANPKPFEWNIQSVNGLYFFVGVPTATLSMGFADYEAQESKQVAVTTSDSAPSQIWWFETMHPLASATFSHSRLLTPGAYIIELSQSNAFLVVSDTHNLTVKAQRGEATRFHVTYKDDHTSRFTLSYRDSSNGQYFIIANTLNGGRVETNEVQVNATQWAVLRLEPGEDVYHIIQADVQDPQRSISSRRIASMGRSYFAIDPLARGEVMQMFRFHPIM
ncbi:hypothetical protein D9613_010174 [Agrocybe pediades]|uniref:Ricin B lectin domain-containing protein n=1 Tax=Agrocybe pediades TaxID=84607 RepID=A0A8H4QXF2_9AGAR|nr:hypothetical protein D9613_010174 [Agrocybe pediades]